MDPSKSHLSNERCVLQFVGNGVIRNVSVPSGRIPTWQRIARIAQRALNIHKNDFIVALLCENAKGDILDLSNSSCLAEAWERVQVKRFLVIHVRVFVAPTRRSPPQTTTKPKSAVEYELGPQIGQGEFGPVYVCYLPRFNNYAAVKEYHPSPDEATRDELSMAASRRLDRLRHEVNFLRHVRHENILRYYGIEQNGSTFRVLMEYLDGGTLRQYLNTSGPLPIPMVKAFLLDVLSALDQMHSHGIVHGAVESDNVMLSSEGVVKLSGLGFARRLQKKTKFSLASKSDIFNVGITALEMITGEPREALLDVFDESSLRGVEGLPRLPSDGSTSSHPSTPEFNGSSLPPRSLEGKQEERFGASESKMGVLSRARSASEAGGPQSYEGPASHLQMISENWLEEKDFDWGDQNFNSLPSSLEDSHIRRRASTMGPGALDEDDIAPGPQVGKGLLRTSGTSHWEEVVLSSGVEAAKQQGSSEDGKSTDPYLVGPDGTAVNLDGVKRQRVVLRSKQQIASFLKRVLPPHTPSSLVSLLQLCLHPDREERPGAKSLAIHPFLFDHKSPKSSRRSIQASLAKQLRLLPSLELLSMPSLRRLPSIGAVSVLTLQERMVPIPTASVLEALGRPITTSSGLTEVTEQWEDLPWFTSVDEYSSETEHSPAPEDVPAGLSRPSEESPVEEKEGGDVLAEKKLEDTRSGFSRPEVVKPESSSMMNKLHLGLSPLIDDESLGQYPSSRAEDSTSVDLSDLASSSKATPAPDQNSLRARLKKQAERRLRRRWQLKATENRRHRAHSDAGPHDYHSDGEVDARARKGIEKDFKAHVPVGGLTERASDLRPRPNTFFPAFSSPSRPSSGSPHNSRDGGASGYESDRSSEGKKKTKFTTPRNSLPRRLQVSLTGGSPRDWLSSYSSYESDGKLSYTQFLSL